MKPSEKKTTIRILVIDDVPETGELLKVLIEADARFQVLVAQHVAHAIYLIQKNRPNWILLDEVLTVGDDSSAVIHECIQKNINILMITGVYSDTQLPFPVKARLIKPELNSPKFTHNEFMSQLSQWIGRSLS